MSTTKDQLPFIPAPRPITRAEYIRRKKYRCKMTIIRLSIIVVLAAALLTLGFFHGKRVSSLKEEIEQLTVQLDAAALEREDLLAHLHDSEHKLQILTGGKPVERAKAPLYDLPLSDELQEYTYAMCEDYRIPEHYELILAMMWQESNFMPDIISDSGDYGLMQVNCLNHEWLEKELGIEDFLDPADNIHAGVFLMARLIHMHGDINKALMAYNMGERGAKAYWEAGNYSNAYCDKVLSKVAAVKMNNYRG